MNKVKRAWHYLLAEPFSWIFYCFFQPGRFRREFSKKGRLQRIKPMLRLAIPISLLCYPFALLEMLLFLYLHVYNYNDISAILLLTTLCTILCTTVSIAEGVVDGIVDGIVVGIVGSIVGSSAVSIVIGIAVSDAAFMVFSIAVGIAVGIAIDTSGGITFGIGRRGITNRTIIVSIACGIVSGIAFGIRRGIAFGISRGITGGIAVGIAAGIAAGVAIGTGEDIAIGLAGSIVLGTVSSISGGIIYGITLGLSFIAFYLVGFDRLLLYPISGGTFLFQAYIVSRKRPQQVFTALHHSSLHWDERVYLPLPFLKRTLHIALEEDVTRTLAEIAFIASKRPQQLRAARTVSLEIAMRDLEKRVRLVSIAEVSQRLNEIFPSEANLIDPHWITPFARLHDASQDAARACSPIGRQARIDALEDMQTNLRKVHSDVVFRDQNLNRRMEGVINVWMEIAQQEQEKLLHAAQEIGRIDNPYKPGQVLKLNDTLFVGRRDLAQQLEEALRRGDRRPTFMLNGERRMGKSTTLVHLPLLLGSRYLPIFCDLQNPGIISNPATFLGNLSKEIQSLMNARGMQAKSLVYELLREAHKESDAAVYHEFDRWLDSIEKILEREDRTLLLMFDEFEKLGEEQQDRQLQLRTLLNWFRNVMQYRSRLALLFSGVRTIGEMGVVTGENWSSYFVNVQTLRVSFLRVEEARQLISKPVPDYPSDEIFGEGVVEKIIAETGCHPFLIQAVCSALIDHINVEKRERAEVRDVEEAVQQVLDAWWDTYFRDLWYRTSEEQRTCLTILLKSGRTELAQIVQQCGLDERQVKGTLQTLLRRNLVLRCEDDMYEIVSPIFGAWVERSLYN